MGAVKIFIGLKIILLLVPRSLQQQNAVRLSIIDTQWEHSLAFSKLINLTELIARDITYKLRHAEKIQEQHKHSITYELGTIAAGILDHFKNMLRIYRKYSQQYSFENMWYDTWSYMYCFHRIQGEYNEIRLERGMFHDIVRDYEATMGGTTKFTFPPGFTLPPRGARRFVHDANGSLIYLGTKSTSPNTKKRVKTQRKMKKLLWKPGSS